MIKGLKKYSKMQRGRRLKRNLEKKTPEGGYGMKHGPYINKTNAQKAAKRYRKKGYNVSLGKAKGKWCIYVSRK